MASSSKNKKVSKNSTGNRSDPAWKFGIDVEKNGKKVKCNFCGKVMSGGIHRLKHHLAQTNKDAGACRSVSDEAKQECLAMLTKNADISKKRKQDFHAIEGEDDTVTNDTIEGPRKSVGAASGMSGSNFAQPTMNQFLKKDLFEETSAQLCRWFYTSAIPFNCVRNPDFGKAVEMIAKCGIGYKPPSYHDVREKYLKKEVVRTREMLEEYKAEWKVTGCSLMSDGWSDRKKRQICNFLVNSPKGTVFLESVDTSDFSKTTEKVYEMLNYYVELVGEENVVQ